MEVLRHTEEQSADISDFSFGKCDKIYINKKCSHVNPITHMCHDGFLFNKIK